MGLIGKLLALPVTGPAHAGRWVLEQIIGAAEYELYDEDRIISHLRSLTGELEAGRITEEEHAAAEAVLLERLMEARARGRAEPEET